MHVKHFLKSAAIGIVVAVLVLVLGVAGDVAWVVWRLPAIHETSGKVPVTRNTTVMSDRSVTVSESYTDFTWTPVHWALPVTLALVGLVAGFSWAYRRNATPMRIYLKSLLVGLCAAAVVLVVCWSAGLVTHVVYKPPPSSHPSLVVPFSHNFVSTTTWELVEIDLTMVRWYVSALAGLAFLTASGWQLRRSWRDRR